MWAFIVHPETGGEALIPVGALEMWESRGWVCGGAPEGLDLDDQHAPTVLRESATVPAGHSPSIVRKSKPEQPRRRSAPITQEEAR